MTAPISAKKLSSVLSIDAKNHRTYTSKHQVIGDYRTGPLSINDWVGVPYGSFYSWYDDFDLWAFCNSVKIGDPVRIANADGRAEELAKWIVTTVHSTVPSGGSNDPQNNISRDNPIDDPPVISGSFSPFFKPVHRDKDGAQIMNTAKHPYTPPVEDEFDHLTLNISYNTANINLANWAAFRSTVNSTGIWGLEARQVKLKRWGWKIQYAGDQFAFIKHDFEFLISLEATPAVANVCTGSSYADKFGWYTVRPNSGMVYYDSGTFDVDHELEFKDSEDNVITTPSPLACDGDRGDPSADQKWNIFAVEKEQDFTSIPGMPNPLPGPFV